MRSRLADRAVREWTLEQVGGGPFGDCDKAAFEPLHTLLVDAEEKASCAIPKFSLEEMVKAGRELVYEQDQVNSERLSEVRSPNVQVRALFFVVVCLPEKYRALTSPFLVLVLLRRHPSSQDYMRTMADSGIGIGLN